MQKRNLHNLSNYKLATFDMGELIPIGIQEVCPADTFQHKTSVVLRGLPQLAPLMHQVKVKVTHWFVPHRIVWDDFNDFITGGDDGLNASTFPTIDFSGSPVSKGDLADYLGLPVGFNLSCSALPFRAYALIYLNGS